jgi:hypothetical protein
MSLLLMMQQGRCEFISLGRNLMYLKLLKNGEAWLRMRQVKD